ncbi:hypothetical protein BVRB_7g166180 [Beta vulgaris subsp. vulgaris]|nr:hypothetical protein BVRB_7g166180 [Beta vulgaris subsp. vulgaris]
MKMHVLTGMEGNHEYAMESLELPSNLKGLFIDCFMGTTIPRWGRATCNWAISVPPLVTISFSTMNNLQEMPVLSILLYLKELHMECMDELEYIELISNTSSAESETFFPSLRILHLSNMEKLKGWWKGVDDDQRYRFPSLSNLSITNCHDLKAFPRCPDLEVLYLQDNCGRLQILVKNTGKEEEEEEIIRLRDVEIDEVRYLKSLPTNCLTCLKILKSTSCSSVLEAGGEIESCASSLQSLQIVRISDLRRLCGDRGLKHFTALESLAFGYFGQQFSRSNEDEEEGEENDDNILWKFIPPSLRSLEFRHQRLTRLPKEIH